MISGEGGGYLGVLNASRSPVEMTWMSNVMNYFINVCMLCAPGRVGFLGFRRRALVGRAIVDLDFYIVS